MAVAIMNTLNGRGGLAGWRWLFIINCIMTICVGVFGFFFLPDTPNNPNPRAFWFKKHYGRLAMERLDRHGKIAPSKITWASAKSVNTLLRLVSGCYLLVGYANNFTDGHLGHGFHTSLLLSTLQDVLHLMASGTSPSSSRHSRIPMEPRFGTRPRSMLFLLEAVQLRPVVVSISKPWLDSC